MKKFLFCLVGAALTMSLALAAGIDGKWVSERKMQTPDGQERTIKMTLTLKTAGGVLTGSVSSPGREGDEVVTEIKEGKVDGSKFNFVTVRETQRGVMKSVYEGSLEGEVLKGTIKREGGQREMPPQPFEAKRAQ